MKLVAMFVSIQLLKLKANCLPALINVLQLCADMLDNKLTYHIYQVALLVLYTSGAKSSLALA